MNPLTSEKCDKAKQRWLEVVLLVLKACMTKSRSSTSSFLITVSTMWIATASVWHASKERG